MKECGEDVVGNPITWPKHSMMGQEEVAASWRWSKFVEQG
jgi:hypothetical protein